MGVELVSDKQLVCDRNY